MTEITITNSTKSQTTKAVLYKETGLIEFEDGSWSCVNYEKDCRNTIQTAKAPVITPLAPSVNTKKRKAS